MRLPRSATVRIAALVFALQLAGAATTLVTVRQITRSQINPSLLIGNYIPNVTAKPFAITKEYVTECYELTKSPRLRSILENWHTLSAN